MRLYNGCPDSELKAEIDREQRARKRAAELGYRITYYPAEGEYAAVKIDDTTCISPFFGSVEGCLEAIEEEEGNG